MKIYTVTYENEAGETNENGVRSVELNRYVSYYGAENIEQVWDAIKIREKVGDVIVGIAEAAPAITILDKKP